MEEKKGEINKRSVKLKNKQERQTNTETNEERQTNTETNEDHLSRLPLDLRNKVLSFLSLQLVVEISLLSREWKESWKNLRAIRLDGTISSDASLLHNHVAGVIVGSLDVLQILQPNSSTGCCAWIDYGIRKHITELDLYVLKLELPSSFFTCRTLKKIKLRMEGWILESLDQNLEDQINLPNLVVLDTCAHKDVYHRIFQIIRGSPALKSVSFCCFGYIPQMIASLPVFPNIECLEFHGPITHGFVAIFHALEMCSMLKHLIIGKMEQSLWVNPESPPSCVVKSLETLKINHVGLESTEFLRYMLKNAKQMKKVEIIRTKYLSTQEKMMLPEEIDGLVRASDECEVHLHLDTKDANDCDDLFG